MTEFKRPPPPPDRAVLRNCPTAERPAREVLAQVSWRGYVPDPTVTEARRFLKGL